MSLRGKIVLLFLGLAVLPILAVAGFGYWHASKLAREVVEVSLNASVSQTARDLDQGAAEVDRVMTRLVESPRFRTLLDDSTSRDAWEANAPMAFVPLSYITVRTTDGRVLANAGTRPETTERCTTAGGSRLLTMRRAVPTEHLDVEIEGGVWLDEVVSRPMADLGGSVMVFHHNQGTVLLSSSCDDLEAGAPLALQDAARRDGGGQVHFDGRDEARLASFVTLHNRPWSVAAHARTDTFLGPLQRLQASYWLFVVMLALATVLAFSILLDRVVMSLEDLTAAAAKIGEGELNPWLPPPGSDEVGRLSLAFSGMLERIRQMMQRVDQSGRLAVVGQLTSYLAHEIRNPLSSIRMNLQSLQRDIERGRIPEESGEAIDISLREVDRLSSSLTSVLQLGRPSAGTRETVSVHDVVEGAAELLAGEFRRREVRLELELDATADRVTAASGQLKGVFLNLMMNAVEAHSGAGRVQIRSRLVSVRGGGPIVAVHVRDDGRGIQPDIRERIFEPFFTTKNQGSGIGLAVALRTVREHGGDLFLADLPETAEGAEFVVELPLAPVVAETIPEPSVELPAWMGADDGTVRSDERWMNGKARRDPRRTYRRIDDAHIRALIELSDSDHGELH